MGTETAERHRYLEALKLGDLGGAWNVVEGSVARRGTPAEAHEEIIAPAMIEIGDLWARGTLGVADEHLATAITLRVLERLHGEAVLSAPRSERVVLAGIEGEHHVVGLRMATDLLELAGFSTHFLGSDVPLSALLRFVHERRPAVVGLTMSGVGDARGLLTTVAALKRAHPRVEVLIGGAGREAVGERLAGAALLCPRAADVVEGVDRLLSKATP